MKGTLISKWQMYKWSRNRTRKRGHPQSTIPMYILIHTGRNQYHHQTKMTTTAAATLVISFWLCWRSRWPRENIGQTQVKHIYIYKYIYSQWHRSTTTTTILKSCSKWSSAHDTFRYKQWAVQRCHVRTMISQLMMGVPIYLHIILVI